MGATKQVTEEDKAALAEAEALQADVDSACSPWINIADDGTETTDMVEVPDEEANSK